MHLEIESYLILQSLIKDKTGILKNSKGQECVASNIDSIMLQRKAVIITDEWFMLHVHHRYLKKIISLLKKSGVNIKDISHFDSGMCEKVYVTQDPTNFIPCLMKFEELIMKSKS